MKATGKLFTLFVVCVAVVYLTFSARTRSVNPEEMNLAAFAQIPVQENGRIMPFDTFARAKLMSISQRQEVTQEVYTKAEQEALLKKQFGDPMTPAEERLVEAIEAKRKSYALTTRTVPAVEWAINAMALPLTRMTHDQSVVYAMQNTHMFRIDHDELLQFLELKPSRQFGLYYRITDFDTKRFREEVDRIREAGGPQKDDAFGNKLAELYQHLGVVDRFASLKVPFLIPPTVNKRGGENVEDEKWMAPSTAMQMEGHKAETEAFFKILASYSLGDAAKFNSYVERYTDIIKSQHPEVFAKTGWEVFFNRFAPYYQSTLLFVGVLLLTISSWLVPVWSVEWSKTLRRGAMALALLTMVVYTIAIVLRIYISGYAPVTNLYSSAIFIGWGCAILCIGLERFLRNGIGLAVASVAAISALIIAHNLFEGDSMGKLVAVLESNFWLSTHVICITLGYTATFVAGFLGIAYGIMTVQEMSSRQPQSRARVDLGKATYGVVCFALFLSFVGTVLGGIWADQSWGRFWGWDPKENGALLLVLWNAIILHARWAGMARSLGVAMLSVFGIVVTSWSWFGTNLLGVGLHSYGFTNGAFWSVLGVAIADVVFIAAIYMAVFLLAKTPAATTTTPATT